MLATPQQTSASASSASPEAAKAETDLGREPDDKSMQGWREPAEVLKLDREQGKVVVIRKACSTYTHQTTRRLCMAVFTFDDVF